MPGGCRTPPLNPDMIAPTLRSTGGYCSTDGHMMDAAVVLAAFYGQVFSQA